MLRSFSEFMMGANKERFKPTIKLRRGYHEECFEKSDCFSMGMGFHKSVMFWGTVLAGDNAPVPPQGNGNQEQQLSDEQKAKVVSILSRYDSSSLTAADAKAINNAFREAGIRQGPGQHEAIEAAGFNPEKISALDPPPNRKRKGGQNSDRDE